MEDFWHSGVASCWHRGSWQLLTRVKHLEWLVLQLVPGLEGSRNKQWGSWQSLTKSWPSEPIPTETIIWLLEGFGVRVWLLHVIWPLSTGTFNLSVYNVGFGALKISISLNLLTLGNLQNDYYACSGLLLEKGSNYAFCFYANTCLEHT